MPKCRTVVFRFSRQKALVIMEQINAITMIRKDINNRVQDRSCVCEATAILDQHIHKCRAVIDLPRKIIRISVQKKFKEFLNHQRTTFLEVE